MNTIDQLIAEARRYGAELRVIEGRLKAVPPGLLPAHLKAELRFRRRRGEGAPPSRAGKRPARQSRQLAGARGGRLRPATSRPSGIGRRYREQPAEPHAERPRARARGTRSSRDWTPCPRSTRLRPARGAGALRYHFPGGRRSIRGGKYGVAYEVLGSLLGRLPQ